MTSTDPGTGTATVADRLRAAGISETRIEEHLRAGRVALNGEIVTGPDHPAPPWARLVLVTA